MIIFNNKIKRIESVNELIGKIESKFLGYFGRKRDADVYAIIRKTTRCDVTWEF